MLSKKTRPCAHPLVDFTQTSPVFYIPIAAPVGRCYTDGAISTAGFPPKKRKPISMIRQRRPLL
ncbi:hypothetical protein HMPREF0262_02381 [Clostridium sp. ATCC 29733]|nr:hypothetical protein HMPREF0262_02381 [Clostridium sp. ATCC 29733]